MMPLTTGEMGLLQTFHREGATLRGCHPEGRAPEAPAWQQ